MPNWCSTTYFVRGPKVQVDELFDTMSDLEKMETPLVENDFGPNWLGCLIKELKGNPESVYCRGSWFNLCRWENDSSVIHFNTDTAWGRATEVENFLLTVFPGLEIFFFEEELGNEIFRTNDTEREFFKEDVLIDEDGEQEYYTEPEALARLSQLKGTPVNDWNEAEEFCKDYNKEHENDDESYIYIYKATDVAI